MAGIIKAPETMTSRERVIRTFQYEKTDRVTIGYETNEGIHKKLKAELGVSTDEQLLEALGGITVVLVHLISVLSFTKHLKTDV